MAGFLAELWELQFVSTFFKKRLMGINTATVNNFKIHSWKSDGQSTTSAESCGLLFLGKLGYFAFWVDM